MKNQIVKSFIPGTLLLFFTLTVFSQPVALDSKSTYLDSVSRSGIDRTKVPKVVTDAFVKEYPVTTNEIWSAFPANGYRNEWYDDDYGVIGLSGFSTQKYYVVEYKNNKTAHKSIYSTDGAKIATHRALSQDVPKPVSEAIASGIYRSWDMTAEKKEIFKDKQTDTMKVYKVEVSNEHEKRVLYYQADGKLLKDMEV